MNIYVTFDSKTEEFSMPVFFKNDIEAKRAYAYAIKNLIGAPDSVDKSLLYFRKDLSLFLVGTFDNENGSFDILKTYKDLGSIDTIYHDFKDSFNYDLKSMTPEVQENSTDIFSSEEDLVEEAPVENVKKTLNLKKK